LAFLCNLDTLRSSRKPLLEARLKAGIESGDIITAVKGQSIKDARELARTIGGLAPGNAVKLDVLHKGKGKVVNLALGQLPNAQEAKADADGGDSSHGTDVPHLGMKVAPAGSVAGAGKTGVVVTGVDPNGATADHGFKQRDMILEVDGKSVANPGVVRDAIKTTRADNKNRVVMRVHSGDASHHVAMPLGNG